MRGNSIVMVVLLLAAITISLATVSGGIVFTLIREPETPDFYPPPDPTRATCMVKSGEPTYIEMNLYLTNCKGSEDAYVDLLGITGENNNLIDTKKIQRCENGVVSLSFPLTGGPYDGYKVYLWKYGYRSDVIDVVCTPAGG